MERLVSIAEAAFSRYCSDLPSGRLWLPAPSFPGWFSFLVDPGILGPSAPPPIESSSKQQSSLHHVRRLSSFSRRAPSSAPPLIAADHVGDLFRELRVCVCVCLLILLKVENTPLLCGGSSGAVGVVCRRGGLGSGSISSDGSFWRRKACVTCEGIFAWLLQVF